MSISSGHQSTGSYPVYYILQSTAAYEFDILVADLSNHRVQIFDENGVFLAKYGSKGTDLGCFDNPFGLAVTKDKIIVGDEKNQRVQIFG